MDGREGGREGGRVILSIYQLAGRTGGPVQGSDSCWAQERAAVVRRVWGLHSAGAGRRCGSFSLQETVRQPATSPGGSC